MLVPTYERKEVAMRILNIVTSPRRERSASTAIVDSFLFAYQKKVKGIVVDTLDVRAESLPEFDGARGEEASDGTGKAVLKAMEGDPLA